MLCVYIYIYIYIYIYALEHVKNNNFLSLKIYIYIYIFSKLSISRSLDISNTFLIPLRVRDIESQLYIANLNASLPNVAVNVFRIHCAYRCSNLGRVDVRRLGRVCMCARRRVCMRVRVCACVWACVWACVYISFYDIKSTYFLVSFDILVKNDVIIMKNTSHRR